MLILVAGAVLPFFWVPILVWLAWRFSKRRTDLPEVTAKEVANSSADEEAGEVAPVETEES